MLSWFFLSEEQLIEYDNFKKEFKWPKWPNNYRYQEIDSWICKSVVVGPLGPPKTSLWATLTLFLGFGPLSPYFMGHTLDVWATFLGRLVFGPLLGHFTTFWATFVPFIGPLS